MDSSAKVLSFFSGKGGVGKSHVCAAMGMALAAQKKSVLWIDMDLGWRNLDFILKSERDIVFDLNHIFQGTCHWREALITPPTLPHCQLIAGTLTQVFTPAMSHIFCDILAQARTTYDYILIDLGSGFDQIHELVFEQCDIPIMISTTDLSSLRSIDKILGLSLINKSPLWILNQAPKTKALLDQLSSEMSYPLSLSIPMFSTGSSFWSMLFRTKEASIAEKILPFVSRLASDIPHFAEQ